MPAGGIPYHGFVDPSGGRHDRFTLAIGHKDKHGVVVVDLVKAWRPPFSPETVVSQCAEILNSFKIRKVVGDAYGGEWPVEQFRKCGITYERAKKSKSELYLELIPVVCSQKIELPENKALIEELRRLERRTARTGRESIDHPRAGSDDAANAVAGVAHIVKSKKKLSAVCGYDRDRVEYVPQPLSRQQLEQRERERVFWNTRGFRVDDE